MAEYQIAQSDTSGAPHFAWGLRKKRLDQSNRLHAAISCHAFCSTAGSFHCSAPTQANSTSWIRLSEALPVENVPSWIAHTHRGTKTHMHADTHSLTHTHTHTHNYFVHFLDHDLISPVLNLPHDVSSTFLLRYVSVWSSSCWKWFQWMGAGKECSPWVFVE